MLRSAGLEVSPGNEVSKVVLSAEGGRRRPARCAQCPCATDHRRVIEISIMRSAYLYIVVDRCWLVKSRVIAEQSVTKTKGRCRIHALKRSRPKSAARTLRSVGARLDPAGFRRWLPK